MIDVAKIKELNLDDYKDMQVPVGISNKHVHVCQADLDVLFGEGHELTPIKDLSQPGQFACDEKVDVVGPKGTLKGVRILGPVRPETQVELAQTDARAIGVNALLRESGKLATIGERTHEFKDTETNESLICDRTFIEAVISGDGSNIRSSYRDGVNSLAFALACNKSMETGAPVKVETK